MTKKSLQIAVAGTGYVGLVAGVAFAEINHQVTCVDIHEEKVEKMRAGICPIYEKDLETLMHKNKERLTYTTDYQSAYAKANVIFIGVGTPEQADGSANLTYVYKVCEQIADSITSDVVVVIKSTVPVGTNDKIDSYFKNKLNEKYRVAVVSNPEFLAQGSAVHDTLYAPRIIVGVEDEWAEELIDCLYEPLTQAPYHQVMLKMNRCSAEMTKYASNDFLALKISYVNEIANLCEKLGANIEDVTKGMGYDSRIGNKFLKAGIGFGGSCFPKDTKALYWLSRQVGAEAKLIKETIEVNRDQKIKLFQKAHQDFHGNFAGKKVAILGVTFKPGTDDLRDAPSIDNVNLLLEYGADVYVYDPIGLENFRSIYQDRIHYCDHIDSAIEKAELCMIMTEWKDVIDYDLTKFEKLMKTPIVYDGRNCYQLEDVKKTGIQYISIGR